ncbi:ABC transporter ATP-binding protein [Variovorax sp. RHLX14]|uniref:ABC transporter ATP-binding protein n=1 Tax=Variovorax sp. RHLX14 TaxID=1259731 RepID=UPI003F44BECE
MTIDRGECVSIVGRSGSGKGVLLRLLADLDPGTGQVSLEGIERSDWPAPTWRSQVMYQAAEPAWWCPTVAEHFRPKDRALFDDLSLKLDLASTLFNAEVSRLSTGERQRLALVRSLARRPAVLLLDEPSASLDSVTTAAMEKVLHDFVNEGSAIVMVTHSREQAGRMSNRIFEMANRTLHAL